MEPDNAADTTSKDDRRKQNEAQQLKFTRLLFCAFVSQYGGWKDSCYCPDGWFYAGTEVDGIPIEMCLPEEMWELCDVPQILNHPPTKGLKLYTEIHALEKWLGERPRSGRSFESIIQKAADRAQKDLSPHQIKITFNTEQS